MFSLGIQIRVKLQNAINWKLGELLLRNFAHDTTVDMSGHVQIFVAISIVTSTGLRESVNEISLGFEIQAK